MTDALAALSDRIADHTGAAAPCLVSLFPGTRAARTGFALQSGVLVTSEQGMPDGAELPVLLPGGATATATLAGRDPGTNVAVLRLPLDPLPGSDADPRTGGLALALGAADGAATASLGVVHRVGPAWDSMAGGRIDHLVVLDLRLPRTAEGGPVLDASGALLGMSTFGPRRQVLVIPAATVRRAAQAVLDGKAAGGRGWLGLGLQPVGLPGTMQQASGRDSGLMVVSLVPQGPAEQAGVLPGDILLDVDGAPAPHPRAVARALRGDRVGQVVPLRLLRGGAPIELPATVARRPAA